MLGNKPRLAVGMPVHSKGVERVLKSGLGAAESSFLYVIRLVFKNVIYIIMQHFRFKMSKWSVNVPKQYITLKVQFVRWFVEISCFGLLDGQYPYLMTVDWESTINHHFQNGFNTSPHPWTFLPESQTPGDTGASPTTPRYLSLMFWLRDPRV